jgi:uncharacterized protein (TIGR00730 family)
MSLQHICVYCGSALGSRTEYSAAAAELGRELATRGLTLIYGGSRFGLMGVLATAAINAGGRVVGVTSDPRANEIAHPLLSEIVILRTMHERKAHMEALADAFVALPGGFGTLEEFTEMLTWAQVGLHRKPCGILNVCGYYDTILATFDRFVSEGFISRTHRSLVLVGTNAKDLIDLLEDPRLSGNASIES